MENSKAREFFCPTDEFRSTLPLSEDRFLDLASKALNVVVKNNKDTFNKATQPEGKPGFSEAQQKELLLFASNTFRLNALMSQGKDQFLAAKLAFAYRLAEELFRVQNGKYLASGLIDFDSWFSDQSSAVFLGLRNVGVTLEIFDEATLRDYSTALYNQEIASGKYTEELAELLKPRNDKKISPLMYTRGLLEDVHAVRTSLRVGKYLGHYAHQHTYLPLAAPIYTLAKAMTTDSPLDNPSLCRELSKSEWNLTYGEIPPAGITKLDPKLRSYWSRLGTMLRDFNLMIQFPHVFAIGEAALSNNGMQPYASRMEDSFHLTDPDHLLSSLGLMPNDPLLQTDTPDIRPDKEPDVVVVAARSMCFRNQEIAETLGTSLFSTRLIDYLLQKSSPHNIMQEFSTKGVRSFLENAMMHHHILEDLTLLNGLMDQYFKRPLTVLDFDNPARVLASHNRFWAFERLLRFPEGNTPDNSELYQDIISGQEHLPKYFPRLAKETKDLLRTRIYTTQENIDEICMRVLATKESSCTLYLEVMDKDGSKIIRKLNAEDKEPREKGIGQTLADWYIAHQGAERVFGAAVISLHYYFYDRRQFQIIPIEYIAPAWESRKTYKLLTEN